MKNVLHSVSYACAILTITCSQTAYGQVYGEYQIVDPASNVYQYNQVQHAPVYNENVVYGESYVESPTGSVDQSDAPAPMMISKDFGYSGPGTMRDHLWRDHSKELTALGTSRDAMMAMTDAKIQALHNEFHADEIAELIKQHPNAIVQESEASKQQAEKAQQMPQQQSQKVLDSVSVNAAAAETGLEVKNAQPIIQPSVDAVSETITDQW